MCCLSIGQLGQLMRAVNNQSQVQVCLCVVLRWSSSAPKLYIDPGIWQIRQIPKYKNKIKNKLNRYSEGFEVVEVSSSTTFINIHTKHERFQLLFLLTVWLVEKWHDFQCPLFSLITVIMPSIQAVSLFFSVIFKLFQCYWWLELCNNRVWH